MKIIYKSFCPPRNLGAFAPWREEFPTPSIFDARLFAQAAQILNYSNTKSTKFEEKMSKSFVLFVSFVVRSNLLVLLWMTKGGENR